MKKIIFTFSLLCLVSAFAREEMPIIPANGSYNIEYIENNDKLINTDSMKNKEKIEEAKNKATQSKPAAKIQFDRKQIIEQRAIDYINRQNNSLLPVF